MKYTFLLSALLTLISLPAHALKTPLLAHLDILSSHRALYKKQLINGLPAEIHDILVNKKKGEKNLTTPEAFVEGITLLKSKKYKSWAQQNKEVVSSVMDSFYKTHFYKNNGTSYEQKVADAIEILYVIQGELDCQPLAINLKKFLPLEEKHALEQYYLDSVKGFPLEIHNVLFRRKKDGKDLTTPEALTQGIALLKSKKYKSWAKQNKEVVSSVMGSFYETHFGYHSNETNKTPEQKVADAKVADAVEILYNLQGELDDQLENKLKSLLMFKEKTAFEKYFGDRLQDPIHFQLSRFLLTISPFLICARNIHFPASFSTEIRKRAYSI